MPASEIVVAVRDPAKARHFADRGVTVRRGDYADPGSLPGAFAGADQLLLVSSSDPKADAVSLHRTAIDAAVTAGVGRILYTSHQGAALDTPFAPGRDHAATEELLAKSGVAWTSLRNGFYAHSLNWLTGPWRETGIIPVPADGPVSWTAREDAGVASELTGRTIKRVVMDQDEWVAAQIAAGQPEFMTRFTLPMYQAAHEGFFAGVDPLLASLLGREPRTVRDVLAQPAAH